MPHSAFGALVAPRSGGVVGSDSGARKPAAPHDGLGSGSERSGTKLLLGGRQRLLISYCGRLTAVSCVLKRPRHQPDCSRQFLHPGWASGVRSDGAYLLTTRTTVPRERDS